MDQILKTSTYWEVGLAIFISFIFFILQWCGKILVRINREEKQIDDNIVGLELCTTGMSIFLSLVVANYKYPSIVPIFSEKNGLENQFAVAFVLIFTQFVIWILAAIYNIKLYQTEKIIDINKKNKKIKIYTWLSNSFGILTVAICVLLLLIGR